MRYPEEVVEEVRTKNDIVSIIGQYVKLKRSGANYVGLCPFHNEKTPSFSVSPSKQMYYCFGCHKGGTVFHFLMDFENMTFQEAMTALAQRAGVELPPVEYSPHAREKAQKRDLLLKLQKEAAGFFYYQLRQEGGREALSYLKNRRLSEDSIRRFGLGYAGGKGKALYRYLKGKGYSDDLLLESGLFGADERWGMYDKFRDRVMFPIMDTGSRVIGFGGRVMGDGKPKYLNSPETMIFDKGRNLYGLHAARSSRENAMILCEGYMDVISLHQAGFTNAVASLGTALTSGHASLLKRYTEEILLLYDSDEAGVRAALRAIPILRSAGLKSRIIDVKPSKDPDEFIKSYGAEAFRQRMEQARDSFYFRIAQAEKTCRMQEPQGQNEFFDKCAAILLEFEDELERTLYTEAVVREYHSYGITVTELRRRVGALAMRGSPPRIDSPGRPEADSSDRAFPNTKKRETAGIQAQKLMLTWISAYPWLFEACTSYLTEEDFTEPLFREVAGMLFAQLRNGECNPARILNAFLEREEREQIAEIFHATLNLENTDQLAGAFADAVLRIRQDSLMARQRQADPSDMKAMQDCLAANTELEKLRKNRLEMIETVKAIQKNKPQTE